ncbi:MAG: exosporium glycoprotein BclB-related protein, partial [Clostridium sp.]
ITGYTPYIGANGNWFINGVDTGYPSRGPAGANGYTPYIGPNGNWFINGIDTGYPSRGPVGVTGATGPQGPGGGTTGPTGSTGYTPYIGANGNWFINGVDTGYPSRGPIGATGATGTCTCGTGTTGTTFAGSIIPYASGVVKGSASAQSGNGEPFFGTLLGFGGSQASINISNGQITSYYGSGIYSFAYSMPRDGCLTDISGYFTNEFAMALGTSTITLEGQVWASTQPNDVFRPVPGATVQLAPVMTGNVAAQSTYSGVEHLETPICFKAGDRILYIFTARGTGPLGSVAVYGNFGGGLNWV